MTSFSLYIYLFILLFSFFLRIVYKQVRECLHQRFCLQQVTRAVQGHDLIFSVTCKFPHCLRMARLQKTRKSVSYCCHLVVITIVTGRDPHYRQVPSPLPPSQPKSPSRLLSISACRDFFFIFRNACFSAISYQKTKQRRNLSPLHFFIGICISNKSVRPLFFNGRTEGQAKVLWYYSKNGSCVLSWWWGSVATCQCRAVDCPFLLFSSGLQRCQLLRVNTARYVPTSSQKVAKYEHSGKWQVKT